MPLAFPSEPPPGRRSRRGGTGEGPTLTEALARMAEAEDALRAIGAGEVDAFVVSDGGAGRRVFTLSNADHPYRMFVENMTEGAATISSNGVILYANRRLAKLLSRPKESIVGSSLATFVAGGLPVPMKRLQRRGGRGGTVELDLVDAHGIAVPVLVGASPLEVDGDHLTCLTFTDLSAQKAHEREIARVGRAQGERLADLQKAQTALVEQATHDTLTGLPNRMLLIDRINQALLHSRRSGRCFAVFFVDIDQFKHTNDTYGHAAGDVVLRRVAERLVAAMRGMDTVARIGGDEFVVLADDVDSHRHAVEIGGRLLAHLSPSEGDEDVDPVAASIGFSVSVDERGTAESLISEADAAMYKAKLLGGGRAEIFGLELGQEVKQRSNVRQTIQSALDDHRIIAYYQPIADLSSGRVAGFEALARISQPDGSILRPAAFIPIAEDSGLVVPLGAAVLGIACAEAGRWEATGRSASRLTVAVNLSARQFESGNLVSVVRRSLVDSRVDPRRLSLELTETSVIDLRPDIVEQLGRIRDLGVEVGLDDFGTGFASLTHLRRLPLTFVKIDQSFVHGLGTDQKDEAIISAVVDLAANLGLRSIAEGVETQQQLDRLRELGCDQAQGYIVARPSPSAGLPTALRRAIS